MTEIVVIPDRGFVTVATFAKIVGVSEAAVTKTLEKEGIRTLKFQKGSSKWLLSLSCIDNYLWVNNNNDRTE